MQGQHLDIISFNRYNAWYQNGGSLDMITKNVVNEATAWFEKYNKPVLMSEYGADTMEGLHIVSPPPNNKKNIILLYTFLSSFSLRPSFGPKSSKSN